jgi:hypothetical protein
MRDKGGLFSLISLISQPEAKKMGRIMDLVEEWERHRQKPALGAIDGHVIQKIVWETDKMVIFRDPDGRLWRRVHSWGMTWPVEITEAKQ